MADALLIDALTLGPLRKARRIKSLFIGQIVERGSEGRAKPLNSGRLNGAATNATEFCPRFRRSSDRIVANHVIDLRQSPEVVASKAARARHISQAGVRDCQLVRPPSITVKDFMPDVGFELGLVVVGIVAAICSARMFFDDPRFPPDTDRTADVEVLTAPPDCEHEIFSSNDAKFVSDTRKARRSRRMISILCF
jgi:hypothetical protein